MKDIQEEITPVESDDLFVVLDHNDAKFDYPIHCHAEYEINLVLHSDGTHIIGTRQEPFSGMDLIIIAPFVPHVWKAREEGNRVVTVQFSGKMTAAAYTLPARQPLPASSHPASILLS